MSRFLAFALCLPLLACAGDDKGATSAPEESCTVMWQIGSVAHPQHTDVIVMDDCEVVLVECLTRGEYVEPGEGVGFVRLWSLGEDTGGIGDVGGVYEPLPCSDVDATRRFEPDEYVTNDHAFNCYRDVYDSITDIPYPQSCD